MLTGSSSVILLTLWFQFGTKHWREITIYLVVLATIGTFYTLVFVPESAQWYHGKEKYDESREALTFAAHYNGVYKLGKN
jgi:uncharacterized membrane protein YqjE